MSRQRESERERLEQVIPSIDQLLANLQSNMRLYDQLVQELGPLKEDQADKDSKLEGVDLETAADQKLAVIAFAALDKVIIDRKTYDLEQQIHALQNPDSAFTLYYRGRIVEVTAENPDKELLHGFIPGNGTYTGKKRETSKGYLTLLNLQPKYGGFLKLLNRSRSIEYQASPLFDREDDYQPLFEVTDIDKR